VIVRGTATDGVAVARIAYSLNGATEQVVATSSKRSVNFEFTVPALKPGANNITIAAFDAAGNQGVAARHVDFAVVRYQVVVAGEFDVGGARPGALNASGDVVIQWQGGDDRGGRGYVWSAGALTELVLPDGHVLMGVAGINASRVAVGDLEDVGTGTGDWRDVPVVWEDGQPTVLPVLPGYTMGGAVQVNNEGVIAGYVMDQSWDNWAAAIWIDREPVSLAIPGGSSVATGINSALEVTGGFWSGTSHRAFRWQGGVTTALEPLEGYNGSSAFALSEAGDVVGYSFRTGSEYRGGNTRATLWRGSTASSLGELPGGRYYRAWGINGTGQAVGEVDMQQGQSNYPATGFISENGRMSLLNHLTSDQWHIIVAYDINDAGQIAAYAVNTVDGRVRAVRLDPVEGSAAAAEVSSSFLPRDGVSLSPADIDRLRPRSPFERMRERPMRR
jgi:uncharacterized membrane protein